MSNDKHAYGWIGHILISEIDVDDPTDPKETREMERLNVIPIPDLAFKSLVDYYKNCRLDGRIKIERLGVTDSEYYFLAAGHPATFTEGYRYYGTVFDEAEARIEGGNAVDPIEYDKEYLTAMLDIYGIKLPPVRPMIGCASEH